MEIRENRRMERREKARDRQVRDWLGARWGRRNANGMRMKMGFHGKPLRENIAESLALVCGFLHSRLRMAFRWSGIRGGGRSLWYPTHRAVRQRDGWGTLL